MRGKDRAGVGLVKVICWEFSCSRHQRRCSMRGWRLDPRLEIGYSSQVFLRQPTSQSLPLLFHLSPERRLLLASLVLRLAIKPPLGSASLEAELRDCRLAASRAMAISEPSGQALCHSEAPLRSVAIFILYLAFAAALATSCITVVAGSVKRHINALSPQAGRPYGRRLIAACVFALLAAGSLLSTWHNMFRFFRWSYLEWASVRAPPASDSACWLPKPLCQHWLRDTALFRQAWTAALATAPRAWWTIQIFGFCAIWSIMLPCQGQKICAYLEFRNLVQSSDD